MQTAKEILNNYLNKRPWYYLRAFLVLTFVSFLAAHPITGLLGGIILVFGNYIINTLAIFSLSLFVVSIFKVKNKLAVVVLGFLISLVIVLVPFLNEIIGILNNPSKVTIYTNQKVDFDQYDKYMVEGNVGSLKGLLPNIKSDPFIQDIEYGADEGCGCSYWKNNINQIYLDIPYEKEFASEDDFRNEAKWDNLNNNTFLVMNVNQKNDYLSLKVVVNNELIGEYTTYFIPKERISGDFRSSKISEKFFSRYTEQYLRDNLFTQINSAIFSKLNLSGLDNINLFLNQILNIKHTDQNQKYDILQKRRIQLVGDIMPGVWVPENASNHYIFKSYTFNKDGSFVADTNYKGEWSITNDAKILNSSEQKKLNDISSSYGYDDNSFILVLKSPNLGGEETNIFHMSKDSKKIIFFGSLQKDSNKYIEINYVKQ